MKKSDIFRPELLAPAGNLETAVAAFNAGADAVYLGLNRFSARSRAENFQFPVLAKLLEFAHSHGKKVYVTLNTLVMESELPGFFSYAAELAQLEPDAVIVQDPGVLYMLRRYFPHLTVHASTQMNIHNSLGIKLLESLGVKRVILERQITLEELQSIAGKTSMELEVFIHGSLCVSLSGRCLLSNYAEQASGNRGMCRQLCRRNYRNAANEVQPYLSPQDLQLMEQIPEFARLGIASLKIEGRLRGPDYVVPVVQAYREALDALPESSEKALSMIRRTVSRPAASGSLYGFNNMVSNKPQALFGKRVGTVKAVKNSGVTVLLTDRIHLGDKLRIANNNSNSLAGFELTRIISSNRNVSSANGGKTVEIPGRYTADCEGCGLFKIGENGYDFKRQAAALPEVRKRIDLELKLDKDGLHVTVPQLKEFEFHSETFAPAQRCAVTVDDLQSVFSAGSGNWNGNVIKADLEGSWFAAKSVLKDLRRELFTALQPHLQMLESVKANAVSRAMYRFKLDYDKLAAPEENSAAEKNPIFAIPGFIAEKDLELWKQKIIKAHRNGIKSFSIGSLHGFMLLKAAGLKLKELDIIAVYPLPAANSQAVRMLEYLGAKAVMPWVELPQKERDAMQQHSTLPVVPVLESCELMATRVPLKPGILTDRDGNQYKIVFDKNEKLTKLCAAGDPGRRFAESDTY